MNYKMYIRLYNTDLAKSWYRSHHSVFLFFIFSWFIILSHHRHVEMQPGDPIIQSWQLTHSIKLVCNKLGGVWIICELHVTSCECELRVGRCELILWAASWKVRVASFKLELRVEFVSCKMRGEICKLRVFHICKLKNIIFTAE